MDDVQKGGSNVGQKLEADQRKAPHDAGNDMAPLKRLAARHAPPGGDSLGGSIKGAVSYLNRTKGGWSGGS